MITLNQLKIFLAVARHEHVTRASEEVNLSQSAVSMSLRDLEDALQGPLFERVGRNLKLNDRGLLLQVEATRLMHHVDDMVSSFTNKNGNLQGELKVGASSTIGNYLMPEIIGRFVSLYPEVTINLEIRNTEQVESHLLDYTLDLGFTEGLARHFDIRTEKWMQDKLVAIAAPEYFGKRKKRISIGELSNIKWIMREKGSGTRQVFEQALQPYMNEVNAFLTFGNTEAVKHAAMAGLGVACLSQFAVAREIEQKSLFLLTIEKINLDRPFWIISRKGSYESRLRKTFTDFVKQSSAENEFANRDPDVS